MKQSAHFIPSSKLWPLLPFWNISWDWSSRSCIFNAFVSSGPYLTPRPGFSQRHWFNMISALYRKEGSVNKAHEPAEAMSLAPMAQSLRLPRCPVLEMPFLQEGHKHELWITASLQLNNTQKASSIYMEIQKKMNFGSPQSFCKVLSSQSSEVLDCMELWFESLGFFSA